VRRLAIDTSSVACTVALQVGDRLIERHAEQDREHTRLLLPMIRETLEEASVSIQDLDAIVLGNGPGSFIGMRIAASVSQGLAHGAGINVIPVSSLAAVAAEVLQLSDAECVAVAQDAHMNEIYLGLYSRGSDNLPSPICEERLHGIGEIDELKKLETGGVVAAGYGWIRYPEQLAANAAYLPEAPTTLYPKARFLLRLSESQSAINPQDVEPAYLRQKVAEKSAPKIL
jgi:tRNA threonylcarbamoyladenosine biosynthesis protein TsaB